MDLKEMTVTEETRIFGAKAPNSDRIVYHKSSTLNALRMELARSGHGYIVVNEVVDGVAVPPMSDGLKRYSFLTSLLQNHGLELREWLADNGCVCRCGKAKSKDDLADAPKVLSE